jgi:hypothetical protein
VVYTLPTLAARYLRSSIRPQDRFNRVADDLTTFLIRRAEQIFGLRVSQERRAITKAFVARGLARNDIEQRRYRAVFEEARRRIILTTSGTQGSLAPAIQVARSMGIAVAEYQHGQTGRGQPEHNFAPTLRRSEEYRATLPDYILGYGRWWLDRVDMPLKPVIIGYPHRSESLLRARCRQKPNTDILVIAKLGEARRYFALASELHRRASGRLKVTFRPNPRDRISLYEPAPDSRGSVEIDNEPDAYTSISRAAALVSGASTTIVEAIGLVPRIFLWEESGGAFKYPEPLFERFSNVGDLIEKLQSPPDPKVQRPLAEDVWASDWRQRYADFITPFLD